MLSLPVSRKLAALIVPSLILPALAMTQNATAVTSATVAGAAAPTSWTASTNAVLPFDMPSTATLQASPKKVFANYASPYPISIDNQSPTSDYYARNYLATDGEGGKHKAYGGYFRDRPLPRAPRQANWKLLDMEAEVRQALSVGIDGFTMVIYALPGDPNPQMWSNVVTMMQAAQNVDPNFKIILMPDFVSASLKTKTPAQLAQAMSQLTAYSSAYRLSDGRTVISPFTAENMSVSWYQSFLNIMNTTYHTPVAFWPLFQNERTWSSSFASISYGMANWGSRNPAWNDPTLSNPDSPMGRVAKIRSMGKKWMQPVSTQDERPRDSIFDEALNTTNLRNTWKIAIDSGSEAVQLNTWNDYPEGSEMAPGTQHGWSYLDISAYYLAWFKTGTPPTITRDAVYLTHRPHAVAADPSYPQQTQLMKLRGGSPARDTVEALTMLKAAATVTVQVGSKAYVCQQAAGVDTCTVPLAPGKVSAKVVRSGATVAGVTSATTVVATPYVQDLRYHAASSGRNPSNGSNGTTVTSTVAVPKTVTVAPLADAYANAGAPTTNYGASSHLYSRGNVASSVYLRYAVPATPTGTTLTTAVLRLQTTTSPDAATVNAHTIKRASDSWSETGLTWNNRPALTGSVLGTLGSASVNTQHNVALSTSGVQSFAGSQATLAVTSSGTDNLDFWSRNYATPTAHTQLQLTYTPTLTSAPAPPATPPAAPPTVTTLAPTADTYANAGAPSANYAGSTSLSSRGNLGAVSYLRFSLPAPPAGRTLTGASLKFRTTTLSTAGSAEPHTVSLGNNTWSESTVSWNARPAVTSTVLGTVPAGTAANTAFSTALSASSLRTLQGTQVTLAVTNSGADGLWFWSSNHAASTYRPWLVLTYS